MFRSALMTAVSASLLLGAAALADDSMPHAKSGSKMPMFDSSTVTTLKGKVTAVDRKERKEYGNNDTMSDTGKADTAKGDTTRTGAGKTDPARAETTKSDTAGKHEGWVVLTMKANNEVVMVKAGPASFVDPMITFSVNDEIEVRGSKVMHEKKTMILPISITRGTQTVQLRKEDGTPLYPMAPMM